VATAFERKTGERLLWSMATIGSVGLALISFRYFLGVGPRPPKIVANFFAVPWLTIHIAGAATALLVGSFQFLGRLRRRWPSVHRWTGRIYVVACLLGGVPGFILALGTTLGPVTTAGFGTLAIIWLFVTGHAWQLAWQRRFAEHRRWMIRSWVLTFAAVNLRLYLLIADTRGYAFDDSYPVISFLCWVPNLIAAELYLMATDAQPAHRSVRAGK
jgi:uncharacterized membrane protein